MPKSQNKDTLTEQKYMELAESYFLNNKFNEALAEFKKVLEINPSNAQACYNIGLINERLHNVEMAKEMYGRALEINKDYKIARQKLNNLMGLEK